MTSTTAPLYRAATGNGNATHLATAASARATPALCGKRVWSSSTPVVLSDLPQKVCRRCASSASTRSTPTPTATVVARYDFAAQAEKSVDARNRASGTDAYRMEQDPELGNWLVVLEAQGHTTPTLSRATPCPGSGSTRTVTPEQHRRGSVVCAECLEMFTGQAAASYRVQVPPHNTPQP